MAPAQVKSEFIDENGGGPGVRLSEAAIAGAALSATLSSMPYSRASLNDRGRVSTATFDRGIAIGSRTRVCHATKSPNDSRMSIGAGGTKGGADGYPNVCRT